MVDIFPQLPHGIGQTNHWVKARRLPRNRAYMTIEKIFYSM